MIEPGYKLNKKRYNDIVLYMVIIIYQQQQNARFCQWKAQQTQDMIPDTFVLERF